VVKEEKGLQVQLLKLEGGGRRPVPQPQQKREGERREAVELALVVKKEEERRVEVKLALVVKKEEENLLLRNPLLKGDVESHHIQPLKEEGEIKLLVVRDQGAQILAPNPENPHPELKLPTD